MKLLAFGEVLWDIYSDKKVIGGAPLNFAAHFKKCGGNSYLVSCVGNDDLGKETILAVRHFGVNTENVSVINDKETGKCYVTLNDKSIPSYKLLNDVSYDFISTEKIQNNYDVLYFGTLALRSSYNLASLKNLLKNNNYKEVFVDVNIRPPYYSTDTVLFALKNATILKISDEELPIVAEVIGINYASVDGFSKAVEQLFDNIKLLIVTLGAKGAKVFDWKTEECFYSPAKKVQVVSTVGAGDSFGATFLYNYLSEKSIDTCLKAATERSGYVVAHKDAVPEWLTTELVC